MSSVSCSKRGGKAKVPVPATASLFALGANDQTTSIGQKRGPPISSKDNLMAAKKPKIIKPSSGEWEDSVIEVESEHLLKSIIEAESKNDESKIDRLLCGTAKRLRLKGVKTDSILFLALTYLAKTRPHCFQTENVVDAFCSILKKDCTPVTIKPKSTDLSAILAANILWATHRNEPNWPLNFVEAYIEDSLGARVWVDHDSCKPLVLNILTAFNTKIPPKNLMSQDILTPSAAKNASDSPASASPPHATEDPTDETSSSSILTSEIKDKLADVEVTPRFIPIHQAVVDYVIENINELLTRRLVSAEINRNALKLLMATVGIPQVRFLVAQKIEIWLQNPKLSRPAQDLLLTVCINCTKDDLDVINALVKMRLKTKPLMNHFMICIKELLGQSDDNLMIVMRNAISNEFSQTRGSNNLQLLAAMFQYNSSKATKYLALLIHEFLAKEDCLRQVRILLREIVRTLRHDHINLTKVVGALTENNPNFSRIESNEILTRIMVSIADLIPLCMFLIISPSVRESMSKPEKKDVLRQTQSQIAEIQRLAIIWMQKVVIKVFKPERSDFMPCLNKVLIMERAEHYYDKDNWPPESDRHLLFRVTTEVPLHEDSLVRILKMGLSKDYPLQSSEAIELSDALIKRAAATYDGDISYPTLSLKKDEIFNLLLKSTIYRIPENITLPSGYEPPSVAITDCYWKVWVQLLIITAYNSQKFGAIAWETYPTLALFIEMCITNQFDFPPATRQHEDLKNNELQIAAIEKNQILLFESHLAAASSKRQITEANSLLLSKLITFDPTGKPRHPSTGLLEDLKNLNIHLKLGYWLCQSRSPDFLLEIIQRQQKQTMSIQSSFNLELGPMQWLNDLIEMNCENFSSLPVQGLCEFALRYVNEEKQLTNTFSEFKTNEKSKRKEKRKKFSKLLAFFHESLDTDPVVTKHVMDYFFKRLGSQQGTIRSLAAICVHLILDYEESIIENIAAHLKSYPESWLIGALPNISNFESVKKIVCNYLRSAIIVETNSEAICSYIQFLAEFVEHDDRQTLLDISRVIIDRATTFKYLTQKSNVFREDLLSSCIKIFSNCLEKIQEQEGDSFTVTDSQKADHILVTWHDNKKAVLHILVVQAMMVLLTYDPPQIDSVVSRYEKLVKLWFSEPMPVCYLLNTNEEALLLPDWLKLKLMRSSCPLLIDAALRDSDVSQLLLFIQSFGIPVPSMDRILEALDNACDSDIETVRSLIPDPSFLQQIVEVQFMRGVKSGRKFAKVIGLDTTNANQDENASDPFALSVKVC